MFTMSYHFYVQYLKGSKMKKVFLALPVAMMLTACGTPSVEDILENNDLAKELTLECQQMTRNEIADSQKCTNLVLAMKKVQKKQIKKMMGDLGL